MKSLKIVFGVIVVLMLLVIVCWDWVFKVVASSQKIEYADMVEEYSGGFDKIRAVEKIDNVTFRQTIVDSEWNVIQTRGSKFAMPSDVIREQKHEFLESDEVYSDARYRFRIEKPVSSTKESFSEYKTLYEKYLQYKPDSTLKILFYNGRSDIQSARNEFSRMCDISDRKHLYSYEDEEFIVFSASAWVNSENYKLRDAFIIDIYDKATGMCQYITMQYDAEVSGQGHDDSFGRDVISNIIATYKLGLQ